MRMRRGPSSTAGSPGFSSRARNCPEDLVEYFASFQQIVSYLYDPDGFFEGNLRRAGVRHFLHGSPKLDDSAHAAQQLAQPLESLALYLEEKAPVLFPSEADRRFRRRFHRARLPGADGPLIALHPGSGGERKNWPVAQWAALGETLFRLAPGARVLLVGGEADHGQLAHLREAWADRAIHVAMDLPLPDLAAILQRAAALPGPRQRHLPHRRRHGRAEPAALWAHRPGYLGALARPGEYPRAPRDDLTQLLLPPLPRPWTSRSTLIARRCSSANSASGIDATAPPVKT